VPNKTLPEGYPDPLNLLRDPGWEQNYPIIILRGIQGIIERERKAGRGSLMESYIKAFNVIIMTLAKKSDPPRIRVNKEQIQLTSYGMKRDEMLRGMRRFDEEAKKSHGNKTKAQMQKDTKDRMKKLRIWIDILVRELPDGQPQQSPVSNP